MAIGYSPTENGQIWSQRSEKFLSPKERGGGHKGGYLAVCLYLNGKPKTVSVHRLIAEAFIPNPEGKPCVNHKDGNKHNNNVSNLEWVTHKENSRHAEESGLIPHPNSNIEGKLSGEGNGRAKLTVQQVREIRANHKNRKRGEKTWDKYGVSNVMYYNIVSGRNWRGI